MSKFLQRIVNALDSRPWRLVLEKRDSAFALLAFKGNRSATFSDLLDQCPQARQIEALVPLSGAMTTVPPDRLLQTRQLLPGLESASLKIEISAGAEAFQIVAAPPGFKVSYDWSEKNRYLERQTGVAADYCGNGWFVSGTSGWRIGVIGGAEDVWLNKVTIEGQDVISFLNHVVPAWEKMGLPITCELKYSALPVVELALRYVCDDYLDCAVTWNAPARTIRSIPSLDRHVLAEDTIRPGVSAELLGEYVPRNTGAFRIVGQQIPLFVRDAWPRIKPWATGDVTAFEKQHRVLTGAGSLSLIVEPADRRGMTNVLATPVFACEGILQPAEQVSRQLDAQSEFIRLPDAWASARAIRETGIGPLGRLADGTSLAPIPLTATEVLKRGSSRLNGPWARVEFPAVSLPDGRSAIETAQMHLEFLNRWHIPGGLIGDLAGYRTAFLALFTFLISKEAGLKLLLVAAKKDLDDLGADWAQIVSARFEGNRRDPQSKPMPRGLVLATSKAVETVPELTKVRWDLLCILSADTLIKTPNSNFYLHLSPCHRSLTVGLFSGRDFLKRTLAREALSRMFRIPEGEGGDLLWRYGLRDPREKAPALPPPYQAQTRTRVPQPLARPAEVFLGSSTRPATAVPIPPSASSARPPSVPSTQRIVARSAGTFVEVNYSTGNSQFVAAARDFANKREARAQFVPFQCYWPTYSSMTREQQRWYFYWRGQVREGRYPDTDLSYIFVHVYELINNVGARNADDGYERLRQLWHNYRGRFPKLDRYLIDWMSDYAAVYRSKVSPLAIYAEAIALGAPVDSIDLILPGYLEQPLRQMPLAIIEILANYQLRRSKFYLEGHRDTVEQRVPAAIELVNDRMRQQFGGGIFDLFHPGTTLPIYHQAFQRALYAGSVRNITLGTVVPYSQHPPLREFMNGLVKHAENTLRKQAGYTGKLYGYSLEPEIRAAIEECLGVVRPVEVKAPPRPQVQIDLTRVEALTAESDQVRDLLLANQEAGTPEAAPAPPHTVPSLDDRSQPAEAPKGLLTDLQSVQVILTRLGSPETSILLALLKSGGQMTSADLAQALPDVLLEAGIDVINNLALEHLGDILIAAEAEDKILADDYRDELEYLLLRDLPVDTAAGVSAIASQLPPEWAAFAARLPDHELAVLETILSQGDVTATIRLIAEANATMPDALLDSINQVAIDTIGDIIIDTAVDPPAFEDEDIDMVRQLLAETAANS